MSQCRDLNSGPLPYQGNALPLSYIGLNVERETGFEPATFSLEGWRSTNWATPAIGFVGRAGFEPAKVKPTDLQSVLVGRLSISPKLSRWRDSNPRPADYKSAALASWATSAFPIYGWQMYWFIFFESKENSEFLKKIESTNFFFPLGDFSCNHL